MRVTRSEHPDRLAHFGHIPKVETVMLILSVASVAFVFCSIVWALQLL